MWHVNKPQRAAEDFTYHTSSRSTWLNPYYQQRLPLNWYLCTGG